MLRIASHITSPVITITIADIGSIHFPLIFVIILFSFRDLLAEFL